MTYHLIARTHLVSVELENGRYTATLPTGFKVTSDQGLEALIDLCDEILCPCDSIYCRLSEHLEYHIELCEITHITERKVA